MARPKKIEEDKIEENQEVSDKPTKKDEVVSITFKLSNGMTRVFDAETNGDGFEDLAKEFEVTNAGKIIEKL